MHQFSSMLSKPSQSKLSKSELAIVKQRIECAICAFGGTVSRRSSKSQPTKQKQQQSNNKPPDSGSSNGNKRKSKHHLSRCNSLVRRERYEKKLRQQYFEHGNHLSWDVELTKKETSASAVGNATVNEMNPFRQKTLVAPPTFTCTVIDNKRSDTEEDRENSKNMEYQSEDFLFQTKMEITPN